MVLLEHGGTLEEVWVQLQKLWHLLLNQKMEKLKLVRQSQKFLLKIIKVMVLFLKMVMKFMLIK